MSDLRDLYQDVILDHGRHPRHRGTLAGATHHATGHNPLCGDRFTVYLRIDHGIIEDASFEGAGCAISTAAASLMLESVKGKSEAEAEALFQRLHALVTGENGHGAPEGGGTSNRRAAPQGLGKLTVFAGVREFPVRVKCATLPWHTLRAAFKHREDLVSTE